MRTKQIDLHIHSNYSDGLLSPTQIITQAKEKGLQLIALTDHDTIDGISEFLREAEKQNMPVLYGIEFTCQLNGRDLHILGYNFTLDDPGILKLINNFKELQDLYNLHRVLNFEEQYGKTVDLEKIPRNGNMTPIRLAYWLKEMGQIEDEEFPTKIIGIYDLFERAGDQCAMEYLPHLPLAEDVVYTIHKAKGFPVLAHPQNMQVTFAEVLRLYARGLKGIEAFYPEQNPETYLKWAKKLSIAVTAGTDYHGVLDRNERSIGFDLPEIDPQLYLYTGDFNL